MKAAALNVAALLCTECGREHEVGPLQTLCVDCARPLEVRYDLDRIAGATHLAEIARRPRGLWRYRELLPLGADAEPVTLGEGDTPYFEVPRLARTLGLDSLAVKDEALNPTGSFKARGLGAAVTMARYLGATALAVPSAGNAGGALAAYGARAGLPVVIAMPRDVPIANRIEAQLCGAEVTLIDGTIADCGRWIGARAAAEGWFDLSTLKEPYRVEGKKTMGLELAEQCGGAPDVVLYPTGGGTGLIGIHKAFAELRQLGWLADSERRATPRLIAVQAEGCAPIVDAFERGADQAEAPTAPHTLASGLRVPTPVGDRWMLRSIRESGGSAIAVSDAELLAGTHQLGRCEGVFTAPEAGALVAAIPKLLARGDIQRHEQIVLLLTGTGLKYLESYA